jgi:hypothetical protein
MMMSENAPSSRRSTLRGLPPFFERLREQMRNDLAVGGGLENGAFAFQLIAQEIGVDQIAVVRDGDLAAKAIDHERLRVFQSCSSRSWNSARGRQRAFLSAAPIPPAPNTCETRPMSRWS